METQELTQNPIPATVTTDSGNAFPVRARVLPGQVYARADHVNRCIEVNEALYPNLEPLWAEFCLCHEVAHLEWDDHDEQRTNERAVLMFIDRGTTPADRQRRIDWLKEQAAVRNDDEKSNFAITAAFIAACTAAVIVTAATVTGVVVGVRKRNVGWYSWDMAYKKEYINRALTDAFNNAMQSETSSARTFFWNDFCQYTAKDKNFDRFISRKGNTWVKTYIKKFEHRYGFGFEEIYQTEEEESPMPKIIAAIAVAALVAIMLTD